MSIQTDDRLRRESPAYGPDDDWTEIEAHSLGVVFTVRIEPVSARRIMRAASEAGLSPRRLLRDWTLASIHPKEGA